MLDNLSENCFISNFSGTNVLEINEINLQSQGKNGIEADFQQQVLWGVAESF